MLRQRVSRVAESFCKEWLTNPVGAYTLEDPMFCFTGEFLVLGLGDASSNICSYMELVGYFGLATIAQSNNRVVVSFKGTDEL